MSLIITYTLTTLVNLTCMILDSGETCAFYSLQRRRMQKQGKCVNPTEKTEQEVNLEHFCYSATI